MSNINKAAVFNPLPTSVDNIVDSIPRASTSKFGVVTIGSGINIDSFGRIYLDTKEYSDRLTAIEAQAASNLATQKSEVAAAIAQVNLAQSQTITALTLEVSNLKTNLTASISATKTDLINRADQLAQNVTDITQQLTQDKAAFTKEIQDALVYLENASSVASALRTPRKIQGVDFDGTKDISLPTFTIQSDGLVPKREGATTTKYLREDGTWVIPPDTTYPLLTKAIAETGTATTANTISAQVLKDAIKFHTPAVTAITGNAGTATKLATACTLTVGSTGKTFDGSANVAWTPTEILPTATSGQFLKFDGTNWIAAADNNTTYSAMTQTEANTGTAISSRVITAAALKEAIQTHAPVQLNVAGNAATATKLTTARTINGVSFDGTSNIVVADSTKLPITGGTVNGSLTVTGSVTLSTVLPVSSGGTGTTTLTDLKAALGVPQFIQITQGGYDSLDAVEKNDPLKLYFITG